MLYIEVKGKTMLTKLVNNEVAKKILRKAIGVENPKTNENVRKREEYKRETETSFRGSRSYKIHIDMPPGCGENMDVVVNESSNMVRQLRGHVNKNLKDMFRWYNNPNPDDFEVILRRYGRYTKLNEYDDICHVKVVTANFLKHVFITFIDHRNNVLFENKPYSFHAAECLEAEMTDLVPRMIFERFGCVYPCVFLYENQQPIPTNRRIGELFPGKNVHILCKVDKTSMIPDDVETDEGLYDD